GPRAATTVRLSRCPHPLALPRALSAVRPTRFVRSADTCRSSGDRSATAVRPFAARLSAVHPLLFAAAVPHALRGVISAPYRGTVRMTILCEPDAAAASLLAPFLGDDVHIVVSLRAATRALAAD